MRYYFAQDIDSSAARQFLDNNTEKLTAILNSLNLAILGTYGYYLVKDNFIYYFIMVYSANPSRRIVCYVFDKDKPINGKDPFSVLLENTYNTPIEIDYEKFFA